MTEPHTLYKLIILYMLQKVNFPLTNSQISNFVLDHGYTSYFTLQEIIHDLLDSELIHKETIRNNSLYSITEKGMETLGYFKNKISSAIRLDIDDYLEKNRLQLRNEISVTAEYYMTTQGEYAAECKVREKNADLIHLTVTVPLKEQAISICDHWQNKCQNIYSYLMKELL